MFEQLPPAGQDPLMQALELVRRDRDPDKVDLSIGVYMDDSGRSIVLPSVKRAEERLLATQPSKSYLSSAGNPAFVAAIEPLLFGEGPPRRNLAMIQTVGGSGALRVAAELIRQARGAATIWIPDPTWANHAALAEAGGLTVRRYPYYDLATNRLTFDAMIATLAEAGEGDVVILQACCHNPSGADLDLEQWAAVAELLRSTGALPLVDMAYQGFAAGIEEDAAGLRLLAARVPELLLAVSFSKNFGLYRDRVGALALLCAEASVETAWRHMMRIARTTYSMPADHGAAVVATILGDPELAALWRDEVATMRGRIRTMRGRLATLLGEERFGYITGQNGMFSFLDLSPEQVARLRERHHIYAVGNGRINLAGLTGDNIGRVAAAIAESLDEAKAAAAAA
jgi:aspartate aminotransferase